MHNVFRFVGRILDVYMSILCFYEKVRKMCMCKCMFSIISPLITVSSRKNVRIRKYIVQLPVVNIQFPESARTDTSL